MNVWLHKVVVCMEGSVGLEGWTDVRDHPLGIRLCSACVQMTLCPLNGNNTGIEFGVTCSRIHSHWRVAREAIETLVLLAQSHSGENLCFCKTARKKKDAAVYVCSTGDA